MVLRTTRQIAVAVALASLVVCLRASRVCAEPVLISIEGQAALAITEPQSKLFGPGGGGSLGLQYPLARWLLLGARLRAGLLSNGDPPTERGLLDPGLGSFELATLTLRLRPFASSHDVRRANGFFIDLGGGGGLTGKLGRPAFDAGLGYGIPLGVINLAPTARYLQIVQPTRVLESRDARLVLLGIELTFNDARRVPPPPPPAPPPIAAKPETHDRDHDGIDDEHDKCPDVAEDFDGFEDTDGCPDPDNDNDRILDPQDKCPNEPEDYDGFEDADGCPDPDNDHDGFLDADDQCPDEAEVVNGNKDFDGCPDEGLIVMENDRIVLEERVLFDFERSRVKSHARPILHAIADLIEQHPDWSSLVVEGHADARGNARFNQQLSEERARHVMQELIKLGIPAERIRAVGFGATRLRDQGDSEEAHQRNRRVEFVVEERSPVAAAIEQASKATPDEAPAPPPARDDVSGARIPADDAPAPPSQTKVPASDVKPKRAGASLLAPVEAHGQTAAPPSAADADVPRPKKKTSAKRAGAAGQPASDAPSKETGTP
jgi:outer membrane protein OmpA-like peptidoglycan-associated protein